MRLSLLAILSVWIGDASALGLGELRTRSYLGEPLVAEVEVLTSGKEIVDASCFRLRSPQGDADLPWLRRGTFSLRRGPALLLEIRSDAPLRDPVLQVGVAVGCGHEVQRDFTLFLSPRSNQFEPPEQALPAPAVNQAPERPAAHRQRPPLAAADEAPPKLAPRRAEKRAKPAALRDRLVLSSGGDEGAEPSLRLATELLAWKEGRREAEEAQREILRLEYRMLAAMNEQATSQLAAAEKLRNMEATLAELQQRAGEFANRIEKRNVPTGAAAENVPAAAPPRPAGEAASPPVAQTQPAVPPDKAAPTPEQPSWLSEWAFYGTLLGAVLGVGGWIGWRQYRERRERLAEIEEPVPSSVVDLPKPAEIDEFGEVDFHIGPAVEDTPMQVDVPLDVEEGPGATKPPAVPQTAVASSKGNDPLSVAGATVDEHFEANPVMELAEIMLSFGRVKGAAQALQEYIDHNPEEALQPWIRLMDVYRMAGMREEFDRLAQDLNQHFNVEVQQWAPAQAKKTLDEPLDFVLDGEGEQSSGSALPKAMTLEDMEHIRNKVIDCWGSTECFDYLNQLLRDNRGGKRSGFTLPVVEEILFLIELLETRKLLES